LPHKGHVLCNITTVCVNSAIFRLKALFSSKHAFATSVTRQEDATYRQTVLQISDNRIPTDTRPVLDLPTPEGWKAELT